MTARELARLRRAEATAVADEHLLWLRSTAADAWLPLHEMLVAWLLARGPPEADMDVFLEGAL